MPIIASDIIYRLSVAAAAGDTTASTPNASLGDQVSTTLIVGASLDNLFDDVDGGEAAAGDIEYRCFFVLNNHATLTLTNAILTIVSQTGGAPVFTVGLDPAGITAKGSGSAQAATIANESAAPAGVVFSAGPLNIGRIAPGQVQAVWVKRTVTAGQVAILPVHVLRVTGDTLP